MPSMNALQEHHVELGLMYLTLAEIDELLNWSGYVAEHFALTPTEAALIERLKDWRALRATAIAAEQERIAYGRRWYRSLLEWNRSAR